jgi:hypothetical protein
VRKFFGAYTVVFFNFKAKHAQNGSKNWKNGFCFCKSVLEFNVTSIKGPGVFTFSKRSKSLYTNAHFGRPRKGYKHVVFSSPIFISGYPFNLAVESENVNRFFTQKWHVQIASNPRPPQFPDWCWITVFFPTHLLFYQPYSNWMYISNPEECSSRCVLFNWAMKVVRDGLRYTCFNAFWYASNLLVIKGGGGGN